MIRVKVDRKRRVVADARVTTPLAFQRLAGEASEMTSFIQHDLFHDRMTADRYGPDGQPALRSRLRIRHRLLSLSVMRVGRLLWRDSRRGFGFSDLSARDPRRGFPHTCHYRLSEDAAGRGVVTIGIRGRWTARVWPRWAAALYIRGVLRLSGLLLCQHLTRVAAWRAKTKPATGNTASD